MGATCKLEPAKKLFLRLGASVLLKCVRLRVAHTTRCRAAAPGRSPGSMCTAPSRRPPCHGVPAARRLWAVWAEARAWASVRPPRGLRLRGIVVGTAAPQRRRGKTAHWRPQPRAHLFFWKVLFIDQNKPKPQTAGPLRRGLAETGPAQPHHDGRRAADDPGGLTEAATSSPLAASHNAHTGTPHCPLST